MSAWLSCSWSYQRHPDSRMQQEQTCKPRGQTAASRRPLLTSANSLRASTSAAVCTAARRRADSINARSTPAIPGSSAVSPRRRLPARASGWSCGDTEAEPVDTLDDVERLGLRRASGATDNQFGTKSAKAFARQHTRSTRIAPMLIADSVARRGRLAGAPLFAPAGATVPSTLRAAAPASICATTSLSCLSCWKSACRYDVPCPDEQAGMK